MSNYFFFAIPIAIVIFLAIKLINIKKRLEIDNTTPPAHDLADKVEAVMDVGAPYKLVQARHGWMLVNPSDFYLGKAIIQYGECAEQEVGFLNQLLRLRPGSVVEVGTNIGTHTVPLAKQLRGQHRELIVFEPQPFIFQNMCANLALNGLDNVRAWPWACAAHTGNVYFEKPNYAAIGNFGGISMVTEPVNGGVTVPCVKLDDVLDTTTISLMKIDVEGFEQLVLEGAVNILAESRPILYLENDRVEKSKDLIEWLWSKNYRLWWHIPPLFNSDNFFGVVNNIYGNVHSFNMMCFPRELNFPTMGMVEITDSNHHPLKEISKN